MNGKSVRKIYIENIADIALIIVVSVLAVFILNKHWFYQSVSFYRGSVVVTEANILLMVKKLIIITKNS